MLINKVYNKFLSSRKALKNLQKPRKMCMRNVYKQCLEKTVKIQTEMFKPLNSNIWVIKIPISPIHAIIAFR